MNTIFSKAVVFILCLIVLVGCWSKKYDYGYGSIICNATNDTIEMIIGGKNTNTQNYPYRRFNIIPFDTIDNLDNNYIGGIKINEGMDAVKVFLNRSPGFDTILIYRHDTLKALWSFPAFSGPCTEHSFFNYNSWKTWLIDEHTGYMMFTILPSDLILNGD